MESPSLDLFRQNQLFIGVDPSAWDEVRPHLRLERYGPGEVIFHEGEEGDWLYLIGSGVVRISKAGRGGQQETLTLLEADDFFGDLAAFNLAPRSARATAVDEVTAARLDRAGLEALMKTSPLPVAESLSRGLIRRLRMTNEHFVAELLTAERLSLLGTMAGTIAHDMINALNGPFGYLQLLREDPHDPDAAYYVEKTSNSLRQMLDMLQELLDFSRGSSFVLRLEQFELRELLDIVDEQYLSSLPRHFEVQREIAYGGPIVADRMRLSRVLINLCKNAVEAMPGGGRLQLKSGKGEEGVLITITDSGCGIPPELLPRVFEPFVTHGKQNGTGLGMAIVRSIIDAHGGTISLHSTVGEGTAVRIRLPMAGRGD